jgi:hypothetical protein
MTPLRLLVFVLVTLGSPPVSSATVITFEDGVSNTAVLSHYAPVGVVMPNWRFHDGSVEGNVKFPFIDNRGVVVDFGVADSTTGRIGFAAPIHGLTLDGFLQADVSGALRQWTLTAYDRSDGLLGSVSGTIIGVGSPVPGTFSTFLPSALSLSFEGNQISGVAVSIGGPFDPIGAKFGVDTLLFTPDIDLAPIPEPATLLLFATTAAGLGLAGWSRRRGRERAHAA